MTMRAQTQGVERRIAAGYALLREETLPDVAVRAAEQAILDWLGCLLIGAEAPPALAIAAAHSAEIGSGVATCFVGPSRCYPGLAALISGTASHTLELDDIYSPGLYHPSVCVMSAALAASQLAGVKGDTFLRSVIAGYEISNRIGAGLNPDHYKYWHTTGTVGTLGATIAAATALSLSEAQVGHAIAHATSMAAGLQQAFRSDGMTKPLHAGRAAEAGLLAARIAKAGLIGSSDMISGPVGLAQAMSHGRDISNRFDDLLQDWTVTRSMFKRFSACGHTFAPVDLAIELKQEADIDPAEIQRVDVATYATALKVAGISQPKSPFEAKFSIPFGMAATLLGHDLTDPTSFEKLHADRSIAALIPAVHVSEDAETTAAFPALRGARVSITMKNGKVHAGYAPTRKGEPANPLLPGDLERKFRRLVEATSRPQTATAWMTWVKSLAKGAELAPDALPVSQ
jgi:2-methylcitrate dehydratase PrpD